ncbi:hypothetical protein V6259_18910, partial [Marinomonas sp. TI.3.20]|uniref:hypothetical protein n=1 Tax=Marinomonas sp. TI.3.20 TaxID=3121296 RepID=UPI00311F39AE
MKKIRFYLIIAALFCAVLFASLFFSGTISIKELFGIQEAVTPTATISNKDTKKIENADGNVDAKYESDYKATLKKQNSIARQKASVALNTDYANGGIVIDEKLMKYGVERAKKEQEKPHVLVEKNCYTCQKLNEKQIDDRINAAIKKLKNSGNLVDSANQAPKSLSDKVLSLILPNGRSARLLTDAGEVPFIIDSDGILNDPTTGKPLTKNGKILTRADLKHKSTILTDGYGNYYDTNGRKLKKEKLKKSDLKGMTYKGKATYVDKNGQLRYADGSPVLDENGDAVFYDEDKGFVNASGEESSLGNNLKGIDGAVINADGTKFAPENGAFSIAKDPITKDQLDGMLYDGKATYVDKNGQLRYMDGSPVLDENGDSVFYDKDKGFINKDGKKSNLGSKLKTSDGKLITADGDVIATTSITPLSDEELKGLTYNGKDTYVDKNGQLRYADGSPVLDENGESVFYDKDKGFVTKDGKIAAVGDALRTASGKAVTADGGVINSVSESPITKDQLDGMLYDGKATYVDKNGQLRYADGSPVLDENGESVFYDKDKGFVTKD